MLLQHISFEEFVLAGVLPPPHCMAVCYVVLTAWRTAERLHCAGYCYDVQAEQLLSDLSDLDPCELSF